MKIGIFARREVHPGDGELVTDPRAQRVAGVRAGRFKWFQGLLQQGVKLPWESQ